MQKHSYQVVLTSEPEGGFTVTVPALPGCITYGRTVEEAHKMAIDAIQCYLGSLKKHKKAMPKEIKSNITLTSVSV